MITAKYCHPNNGYYDDQQRADRYLQLNQEYVVEKIVVHKFSSDIYLKGFQGSFNSVLFDTFKNGKLYDYVNDPSNFDMDVAMLRGDC